MRFCSFVSLFCQRKDERNFDHHLSSASMLGSSGSFACRLCASCSSSGKSCIVGLCWSGRSCRSSRGLSCTSLRSIHNYGSIGGNRGTIARGGWDCDGGNDRVGLRILPDYREASCQLKVIKFKVEATIEEAKDRVAALGNLGLLCCFFLEVLGGLLSLTHDGSHGLGKGHLIGPRC